MIQQLLKKDKCLGEAKEVFPTTYIEAVKDKLTGVGLDNILASFNMIYIPYMGSREDTRLQVPKFLRRKGLWITYVDYGNKIRTEWYRCNCIDDAHWQSDIHWNVALDMSDLLEDYFGSDAFYNTFIDALTNIVKNIDINVGVDEETVRKIVQEIIEGLDLSKEIQDAVNNYINSEEFNNTLQELINNLDLTEIVDNSVANYLDNKDLSTIINEAIENVTKNIDWSEYIDLTQLTELIDQSVNNYINDDEHIADLIKQKIEEYFNNIDLSELLKDIDFTESIQNTVNNWFEDNSSTLIEIMTPYIDEKIDEIREELKQWCNDIERVVANALIRHEQWIQEHSETESE